jgi:rhodanese-related sulfurtransferase
MNGATHRRRRTVDDLLADARRNIDRLQPEEAAAEIEADAVLVDTRCDEDRRREGVVSRSVHVPRTVLEWRADPASEHHDPRIANVEIRLIIMCNDGYSSSLAAANLKHLGFERVADVIGGYRSWKAAGLPTEMLE